MFRTYSVIFTLFFSSSLFAQTFMGTGGAISDNLDTTYFPINLNGLSPAIINTSFGLESVCLNINHTKDRDLDIYLQSPDGTRIELSTDNGDLGHNYQNTCFRQDVTTSIVSGVAPLNGSFRPEQPLSTLNNGQNANGTWTLIINDDNNTGSNTGAVVNWSLTFSSNPATLFPDLKTSNLPIMVINTNAQTIVDDPKIACDMGIIYNGVGVRNNITDPFNNYHGKIGIEIRGSSSQGFPKKSYGFETRDALGGKNDTTLLGMPKEPDWILSASYTDKTHIRNVLSYKLYTDFGRYAVRTRYCELVINGQYQGVYVLMEKIKVDKNRVDIAKLNSWENAGDSLTGGYIIKIDKTTGGTGAGWTSLFPPAVHPNNQTIYYQYHYPDADSITSQQKNYIQSYVDSFEVTLAGTNFADPVNGYAKYCDVNSFIDYFILNEISTNIDGYRLSTFLYKDKFSKGGKLTIGPPWDYDIAWLNADYCGSPSFTNWAYKFGDICSGDGWEVPFWWDRFLQDQAFEDKLKCRWTQLRSTVLDTGYINAYIDSVAAYLTEGTNRNFIQWPILGVYVWPNPSPIPATYQGEIDRLKQWISDHMSWLDANMPGICTNAVAENNPAKDIIVFPNPSWGKFTIESSQLKIEKAEVTDLLGRKIISLNTNTSAMSLDLSNHPAGIYIVKIYSGGSFSLHKIIKASR